MRVFKWLLWLSLLLLLALFVAPLFAVYLGLQGLPSVEPVASAQQQDIARLKGILSEHDPRDLVTGETRRVEMMQRDLNIGLGVVNPLPQRQRVRVALAPGLGAMHYSLRVPANPFGEYFNASVLVSENAGKLELESVQLGETEVPGFWLMPFILLVDGQLQARIAEYRDARKALQGVALREGAAEFVYSLDDDLFSRIEARGRSLLMPEEDQARVQAYYQEVARISRSVSSPAPLTQLLQPLFSLALERTEASTSMNNAALESRALLLTLGVVMNGSSVRWLLGEEKAAGMAVPQPVRWTLYGRDDLAQHFGISAALAVGAGGNLADAVGAFKELDDSRGGTGFSFVDLLADRAGVELAGLATGSRAASIQQFLAAPDLRETDILADIHRLPEGLMEMTFRSRYQDLDDARYSQIKREVDVRVAQLPIHQVALGRN